MATTPVNETEELDLSLSNATDWFHEELPEVETEDVGIDPEDLQSWITNEYAMIALLDEVTEDLKTLRTTTKSRVDIVTKLASTLERLQKELASEEDDEFLGALELFGGAKGED